MNNIFKKTVHKNYLIQMYTYPHLFINSNMLKTNKNIKLFTIYNIYYY